MLSMRPGWVSIVLAFSSVTAACGPGTPPGAADGGPGAADASPPGTPDAGPPVERSCATTFRYVATGSIGNVEVAGQWDWDARTPLTDADGDGTYVAALDLAPGFHAYKLIVDGTWILDPEQAWRKYDGGVENSGVRVEDCTTPLLELVSFQRSGSSATATVRLVRGNGGPALVAGDVSASVRHDFAVTPASVTSLEGDVATIALTGLSPGKHTLSLAAQDGAGKSARPLDLPFWVESVAYDDRGIIYMIMLDRFRNGDPSNDAEPTAGAEATADFAGGDLAGVTAAIEDGTFDDLGVTALWISPWVQNPAGAYFDGGRGVTGYHGYWPTRGREIDPRFGSEADLEALVKAAHAHGIRVLMDFVINHVHEGHDYFAAHPTWFRTGCECGTAGCDWTEHRLDCLFHDYMPDVNWQELDASEAMIADALYWLERFDLDGLRVDAVKHVEDLAVTNLKATVHERLEQAGTRVFLLGETAMGWSGDDVGANDYQYDTISRYVGRFGLTGQFDFVLYHAVSFRVFADDDKGFLHADFWFKHSLAKYPADSIMTPYVGSHDTPRFVSLADRSDGLPFNKWPDQGLPPAPTSDVPYEKAAVAYTWLLALPGAPLLYYGDEYGEFGGADPDNRHMWRAAGARSAREQATYDRIARIGRARRDLPALRVGSYRTVLADETFLCFARESGADFALVALNRDGAPAMRTIDVPGGATSVVDLLAPGSAPLTVSGGQVTITLPARGTALYVPAP